MPSKHAVAIVANFFHWDNNIPNKFIIFQLMDNQFYMFDVVKSLLRSP